MCFTPLTEHLQRHCQDLGTSASHGSGVSRLCFFRLQRSGVIRLPILGGNQTIQIYGHFEGFPFMNALFGARCHMMTPVFVNLETALWYRTFGFIQRWNDMWIFGEKTTVSHKDPDMLMSNNPDFMGKNKYICIYIYTYNIYKMIIKKNIYIYLYIYGTPPKKPTFLHFYWYVQCFWHIWGPFFGEHFLNKFEVVFANVYKRYGYIAAALDPRSKIQDSTKNFLDPRSGSKIQDPRF